MANQLAPLPPGIDHLVYASPTLERGMDEIEQLLGARPVFGGRHPRYGTHNALLSLGPATHLEIIARDPGLPLPDRGALVDLPADRDSRLLTWVFRVDDIESSAESGRQAGLALGPVAFGERENPDGSRLHWTLTDPYARPLDGAIPFLIDWGKATHPASLVPPGGQLIEFWIEHPQADRIQRALSAIGASVRVSGGEEYCLAATIRSKQGLVTLR